MAKHIFIVQTNAVEGREDEFNDWYTNVHVPDALAVPGWPRAQRFKIAETQRTGAGEYPYKYVTIYEIEGDPEEALKALAAAVPGMQITTAMADDRKLHVFEAMTEVLKSSTRGQAKDPALPC